MMRDGYYLILCVWAGLYLPYILPILFNTNITWAIITPMFIMTLGISYILAISGALLHKMS